MKRRTSKEHRKRYKWWQRDEKMNQMCCELTSKQGRLLVFVKQFSGKFDANGKNYDYYFFNREK